MSDLERSFMSSGLCGSEVRDWTWTQIRNSTCSLLMNENSLKRFNINQPHILSCFFSGSSKKSPHQRGFQGCPRMIRAILLECTELPPYADALRYHTGLPVWDAITARKAQTHPGFWWTKHRKMLVSCWFNGGLRGFNVFFWDFLGFFGILWDFMGFYGILWDLPSGNLR